MQLDTTGFTLNQIKRDVEHIEKKVDRIMEVPMKNAVTFLKTAHNEIMMGKFKNAYQNLNLVIVKSNEAFDLTARKDINALNKPFMEVDGIGQLSRFHRIINYGTQIVSLKKSQSAANIWNFP